MRIAVVGSGGIGGYYGALLARRARRRIHRPWRAPRGHATTWPHGAHLRRRVDDPRRDERRQRQRWYGRSRPLLCEVVRPTCMSATILRPMSVASATTKLKVFPQAGWKARHTALRVAAPLPQGSRNVIELV